MVYLPVPGKAFIQIRGAGRVVAMLPEVDGVNTDSAM